MVCMMRMENRGSIVLSAPLRPAWRPLPPSSLRSRRRAAHRQGHRATSAIAGSFSGITALIGRGVTVPIASPRSGPAGPDTAGNVDLARRCGAPKPSGERIQQEIPNVGPPNSRSVFPAPTTFRTSAQPESPAFRDAARNAEAALRVPVTSRRRFVRQADSCRFGRCR